jgi:hypothetical protein
MSLRRALILSALCLALGSAPLFFTSFLNDDATYALVGQKLLRGALLYRDAVDNKPPLIYETFAASFALFGQESLVAIKVLSVAATLVCAAVVAALGDLLHGRRAAAMAALLFSLASLSGVAEDTIAPNTEVFSNVFGLVALYWAVRSEGQWLPGVGLAGMAAGVAALYRLQGGAFFAGVLWTIVVQLRFTRPGARAVLVASLGFAVPVAVVLLRLAAGGVLHDFWVWAILGNFRYVAVGIADASSWRKVARVLGTLGSQAPLVLAAALGAVGLWRSRPAEPLARTFAPAQAAIALVAYGLGTRFYGHYFLQVLPFLALLGGWAVTNAGRRAWRLIPHASAVVAAGFLVVNVVKVARSDRDGVETRAASYVRAHSASDDAILRWSGPPGVLFRTGRPFATRFVFNNYLTGRIFGTSHSRRDATPTLNRAFEDPRAWTLFWQDLASGPPPRMIMQDLADGFDVGQYPRLSQYLATHYTLGVQLETLAVYVRN